MQDIATQLYNKLISCTFGNIVPYILKTDYVKMIQKLF